MDIKMDDDGQCVVNCTSPCKGHGLIDTISFVLASDQWDAFMIGGINIYINDLTSDDG